MVPGGGAGTPEDFWRSKREKGRPNELSASSSSAGPTSIALRRGGRRPGTWALLIVGVVAVAAALTALVIGNEVSSTFGCGDGKEYGGDQVCIQDVLTAVSAFNTRPPTLAATCPTVVPVNSSFHCWFNLTSTALATQEVTNLSAGDAGNPFSLLGVSNPLPLTVAPGQVAVEELTIRAPSSSGAYNLLLLAQVVASP